MYDRVGLKVRDLAVSTRFYRAIPESLGLVFDSGDATVSGLGPKGAPAL
jgi:catechol 2,3-dioxygenase-like lactoylglutathione lyase family enzyme